MEKENNSLVKWQGTNDPRNDKQLYINAFNPLHGIMYVIQSVMSLAGSYWCLITWCVMYVEFISFVSETLTETTCRKPRRRNGTRFPLQQSNF